MAYSDFSLEKVLGDFNLRREDKAGLFVAEAIEIDPIFQEILRRFAPLGLAISTEKSRSEFIIAPILAELRRLTNHRISLFSGTDFTVDIEKKLNGICDFIICNSSENLFITAPILMIAEAKNENIKAGMGQCIAAMVAAQIFNERKGNIISTIYGIVTTGENWKFLKLENSLVQIEEQTYYFDNLGEILGILMHIVEMDTALVV